MISFTVQLQFWHLAFLALCLLLTAMLIAVAMRDPSRGGREVLDDPRRRDPERWSW